MGASPSRQEELFLHRRWSELLDDAMTADLEALAGAPSSNAEDSSAHSRDSAATSNSTAKKKSNFQLSFQEWQAFLSVLEQKEARSTPSDIAAQLTTSQLHVPAVALMVHVCAWWRGAISTTVLGDRVEQLVSLVHNIQHGTSYKPQKNEPAKEGVEMTGGDSCGHVNPEHAKSGAAPASRRARLTRFVQKVVVDRARHRMTPAAAPDDAEDAQQLLLLDTFADMTYLVQELLSQEASITHAKDTSERSVNGTSSASMRAREIFDFYDDKISNKDVLKQRPALAVVMILILAIYASKNPSRPQLAPRLLTHVEALQVMLFSSNSKVTSKSDGPSAVAAAPTTVSTAPLVELWPVVGELEVALVRRQHEADVLRCLSSEGDALLNTLRQMREKREMLRNAAAASGPTPTLSASERWMAGATQYIGQRHIWAQLRSHFLSAGVFDANKPTVLVFFGPSGYGKSELAKRVASVLHDCPVSALESSGKMVYIHMPSFCTKDSIYSLVDPPAAHVGSGILLSALQKHPDAVVVLDEFEKSTAESINNLWLSAFQKEGVLRSLKAASRSVSTVRATFILTCNISADSIAAREELYLKASAADQESIRNLFVTQCRQVCTEAMGSPFVNRVDYFFPFMPYTRAERRQFVCLLLERLLASQAEKQRRLYATPSFVEAMVDRLHTFHAATLEEAVRSQVMRMVQAGWTAAVLTVERRIGGEAVVLLPTTTTAKAGEVLPASASQQGVGDEDGRGHDDDSSDNRRTLSLAIEAWDSLPGGREALQKWNRSFSSTPVPTAIKAEERAAKAEEAQVRAVTESHAPVIASASLSIPQGAQSSDSPLLEKQYEHEYAMDKEKIMELEKELAKLRDLVKQRDLEIMTLKEKVLLLQKALAVVILALLSCLFLLAVLIGLKFTVLFALVMMIVVVVVLGVPLTLLFEAVRALFSVLGPFKGGILLLLVALWMAKASRSMVSCS